MWVKVCNFLRPLITACPPLFWGLFFIINVRKCWKYVHSCISSLRSLINLLLLETEQSQTRVRKWSLKFSVAAAITRGTCQREVLTRVRAWRVSCWQENWLVQSVPALVLLRHAGSWNVISALSATYYWDVLHFISHSSVGIIIRIYLRDLHKPFF